MALLKATTTSLLAVGLAVAGTASADTYEGRLNPMIVDTFDHSKPAETMYELTVDDKTYVLVGLQRADAKNLVPNDLGQSGDITVEAELMPGNRNVLAVSEIKSFKLEPYRFGQALEESKAIVMHLTFGEDQGKAEKLVDIVNDVAKAYKDNSWGVKKFSVDINKDGKPDIIGPINVAEKPPKMQCMASIWADNADKIAKEKYGIDFNNYNHRVYYYDTYLKCGWEGLGYVGCTKEPEGKCRTYMNTENPRHTLEKNKAIWVHELGHNLGLRHARKGRNDYGDRSDPMGKARLIHFNGAHTDKLGYLDEIPGSRKDIEDIKGSSVTLYSMTDNTAEGQLKVLRHGKKSNGGDLYYAQLRTMDGIDILIEDDDYYDKVLIHKLPIADGKNNKSEIIAALKDGETFKAPNGEFSITVEPSFERGKKTVRID